MPKLSLNFFPIAALLLSLAIPQGRTFAAPAAPTAPAAATTAPSGASSVPRALLAHGDSHGDVHRFWIARVVNVTGEQGTFEQTQLWNTTGFGDPWSMLPPISSRAVSIASNAGELFVALNNGQCMIADETENRLAPGLVQGDSMIAIANDADALWAIMIPKPPATSPSSTQSDLMPAATLPSGVSPTGAASITAPPRQLVAYRFDTGKWIDPHDLPIKEPVPPMSLAVVDRRPMIAWQTPDNAILVSRLQADNQWSRPLTVVSNKVYSDFKLLSVAGKPMLWISSDGSAVSVPATAVPATAGQTAASTRPSAGTLYSGDNFAKAITLPILGSPPAHGVQTIAVAFGSLRWLASDDDHQAPFQQAYTLEGQPEGPAAAIAATPTEQLPLQPFLVGALALVLVATASAMMQRRLPTEGTPPPRSAKPILAPLGVRFAAGLVDLLPILAVGFLERHIAPQGLTTPADRLLLQNIVILATLTYIAHTLIAELICGQSLGKMLLGLRVTDAAGQPPTHLAITLRNLLRIVDVLLVVPLFLVFFSPQQQRVGDLAGGTIVITREPDPQAQDPE